MIINARFFVLEVYNHRACNQPTGKFVFIQREQNPFKLNQTKVLQRIILQNQCDFSGLNDVSFFPKFWIQFAVQRLKIF